MKKTLLALLCALAAACGGDDAPDPATVRFRYGAPAPVVAFSAEANAASAGEASLSQAQGVRDADDPETADAGAWRLASLPPRVVGALNVLGLGEPTHAAALAVSSRVAGETVDAGVGFAEIAHAHSVSTRIVAEAVATGSGFGGTGYERPCVIVTPGMITWSGCVETTDDPVRGSTVTRTVDGTLTRDVVGGTAVLGWDLRVQSQFVEPEFRVDAAGRFTGGLGLGATSLTGAARVDSFATYSYGGGIVSSATTDLADYDLSYETPFCLVGGTLEARRVWTKRPAGEPAAYSPDVAVRLTYGPGCGEVMAARGVR